MKEQNLRVHALFRWTQISTRSSIRPLRKVVVAHQASSTLPASVSNGLRGAMVRPLCIALLVAIDAFFPLYSATARTWHIRADGSGDAPTIQAGIDSAMSGDSIVVAPGTYYETLDVGSKDLSLQGSAYPDVTVIDAGRRNRPLRITAGVVEGFTFRNGLVAWIGGGVLIQPVGPTVFRNNIVENNIAGIEFDAGGGGGVAIYQDMNMDVLLENNVIRNNSSGAEGGGLLAEGGVVHRNAIFGNATKNSGGGVQMWGTRFTENQVFGNEVAYVGAGIDCGGSGEIRNNTIIGNVTTSSGLDHGCGIEAAGGTPVISHNIVVGNHSSFGVGGAGIRCGGANTPVPECNDIWGNDLDVILDCETLGGSNFSADPQFCAADPIGSMNFGVQSDSPCAPGQDPSGSCGLVGAGTVSCDSVSVARRSWTDVKLLFR